MQSFVCIYTGFARMMKNHNIGVLGTQSLKGLFGILISGLSLMFSPSCGVNAQDWTSVVGLAKDIGVGADGSVWIIGTDASPYKWTGSNWQKIAGVAARIAVDPSGNAWVVNSEGTILRWTGNQWEAIPGNASDIGVGADGTVWVIGVDQIDQYGYDIYRWTGSAWQNTAGVAARIAVDPAGNAWVADLSGQIYRWTDGQWQSVAGVRTVKDIGVGADGSVWIIGIERFDKDYRIFRWNGSAFEKEPNGAAVQIAVDPSGNPWVVHSSCNIFRKIGTEGTGTGRTGNGRQ